MSIQKPTAEELKQWEATLQDEGLGMGRGGSAHKLSYGFDDSDSLVRGWDDVKIYTRRKRKQRARSKWVLIPHCGMCGQSFTAKRIDARFCSEKCCVKNARRVGDKSKH